MNWSLLSRAALTMALVLASARSGFAQTEDYSNWTRNLSISLDTATEYYDQETPNMVVSGQNVHFVWLAAGLAQGTGNAMGDKLFYRHSSDGGKTFSSTQTLTTDIAAWGFSSASKHIAVDGSNVHIVYDEASSANFKYLRSTDNGLTFEAPKTVGLVFGGGVAGFPGFVMQAGSGTVAMAWASNSKDAPYNKDVFCTYSKDAGATLQTTTIAHTDSDNYKGFSIGDMALSGSDVYVLYTASASDSMGDNSTASLYLASSNDGGTTFNPSVRVNVPSSDNQYHANKIQDGIYTPNLAVVGKNVFVTWVNTENFDAYNGTSTYTPRVSRSTDKGITMGSPVTLSTQPLSSSALPSGQESIAAFGNNVYVTTIESGNTMFWRSTDGGISFGTATKITDGGWYPQISVDPSVADGSRVYVYSGSVAKSVDSGAAFNGVVTPSPAGMWAWNYPLFSVGTDGTIHIGAQGHYYDTTVFDMFYCRQPIAPAAGPGMMGINLTADSTSRHDNMQIAASPDINQANAMTIEYWLRMDVQGDASLWPLFQIVVAKGHASYSTGTIEMGRWDGFTGFYGRLVTENASDQRAGDFLGTSIVPEDQTWYHLAMTYDANGGQNNWKFYVNGGLANSATLTTGKIVMDYMPLVLGVNPQQYGKGAMQIGNMRIWNYARSAAEIGANSCKQLLGNETGLVAYYTLSNSAQDVTLRGNDGMLTGMESFVDTTLSAAGVCAAACWQNGKACVSEGTPDGGGGSDGGIVQYPGDGGLIPSDTRQGGPDGGVVQDAGDGGVRPFDASADTGGLVAPDGGSPTKETILFKMESVQAVSLNPPVPTVFTLAQASYITRVWTYHYDATIGLKGPTVKFQDTTTGVIYGPWAQIGYKSFNGTLGATEVDPGNVAGPPDNYWMAYPGQRVPAGNYQVIDSDPTTWCYTSDQGNRGIAWVYGWSEGASSAPDAASAQTPDVGVGAPAKSGGGSSGCSLLTSRPGLRSDGAVLLLLAALLFRRRSKFDRLPPSDLWQHLREDQEGSPGKDLRTHGHFAKDRRRRALLQ
jgi:hypothetical protein